jgi:hypothetical protein
MARYVIPTSDTSARVEGPSGAPSNVQPPTPVRRTADESVAQRGAGERSSRDGSTRAVERNQFVPPPPAPLPTEYRGKSSGEFQRVSTGSAPDANSLIAEAERYLLTLAPSDRNRRLVEVAILRRDTALLGGLLEVFRRQGR